MQATKRTRRITIGIRIGAAVIASLVIAGSAVAQDVLISEIAWSGSSGSSTHEWIELRSLSGDEIDLAGWRLASDDGYPTILLSGVIEPFGYFLLERETDDSVPCVVADLIYSGALRDGGETLRLFNAAGVLIDVAESGGKGWPAGTDSLDATPYSSMERILPGLATASAPWQTYRRDLDVAAPPCAMILGTPGRENSVESAPPIAVFTIAPNPARPGESVLLDARASVDPSGEIRLYEWIIDDGAISGEQTASVVFGAEGDHEVVLTITDWKGTSESATGTVTVAWNSDPVADFSIGSSERSRAFSAKDMLLFVDESTDHDGRIVSWTWDFGDGAVSHEQQARHAYAESGVYTVTLDVIDDRGSSAQSSQSLPVQNLLPVASFAVPSCTLTDGEIAVLDASSSFDLDGVLLVYRWDFDSDGAVDLIQTESAVVERSFSSGTHLVTLQVQDDRGGISLPTTKNLTVNHPPIPNFTVSCPAPTQCQEVTLDGTFSTDPDGSIESWAWSLGNGERASGSQIVAAYGSPGPYTIGLTVVDSAGTSRTITREIVVSDLPPEAVVAVSEDGRPTGATFSFSACESVDPCGGRILLYEWDLDGDGAYEISGTSCTASRAFDEDGRRSISLRIVDSGGNEDTASAAVTVTNRAPQCRFGFEPATPDDAQQVTFVAQAADPDGEIVTTSWSFGDSTSAAGESVPHLFPDDGTYTVTLTVTDDDDCGASCSQTIVVGNAPPVAAFEMNRSSVPVGSTIQFSSLAYDPSPTGRIVHVAWDFGDGGVAFGQPADSSTTNILSPSHAYDHGGTFVVSLAVIDEHGALSIASQVVTILE